MIAVVLVVVAAAVAGWVLAPLRRSASPGFRDRAPSWEHDRDRLRAARDATYHSLRDLDLDFGTGKLSPEDYADLRARFEARAGEIARRLQGPPAEADAHAAPPTGGRTA